MASNARFAEVAALAGDPAFRLCLELRLGRGEKLPEHHSLAAHKALLALGVDDHLVVLGRPLVLELELTYLRAFHRRDSNVDHGALLAQHIHAHE